MPSPPVKVRFAPSPTGSLHLGSALVALANAMFARANEGTLLLRIDDTDAARSSEAHEAEQLSTLRWLGIEWDDGPIRQRDRVDFHLAAANRLLEDGRAYRCFCSVDRLDELRAARARAGLPPRYDGRCRHLAAEDVSRRLAADEPHVVRFRVDDATDVTVPDLLRGDVTIPAGSFGDPVLLRADGSPAYVLASVADDVVLGVSHVIRGEDHLVNSAVQSLLFRALDAPVPAFAHVALLRDASGAKLSKRAPLGTVEELRTAGYLPRTVRRYLFELLGQGPLDLLGDEAGAPWLFDRLPTGAPRVDATRLESLGREDVAALPDALLLDVLGGPTPVASELVRELAESSPTMLVLRQEVELVERGPSPAELALLVPDGEHRWRDATDVLLSVLEGPSGAEPPAAIVAHAKARAADAGLRTPEILKPLRAALTGRLHGPAIELVLGSVGSDEARRRVERLALALEGSGVRPLG